MQVIDPIKFIQEHTNLPFLLRMVEFVDMDIDRLSHNSVTKGHETLDGKSIEWFLQFKQIILDRIAYLQPEAL